MFSVLMVSRRAANARTFRGLAINAEHAANLGRALLHALQTKVTTLDEELRIIDETAPIVIHRKFDRTRVVGEGDIDGGGAGVTHSVVHGFLRDAEKLIFDLGWRRAIGAANLKTQAAALLPRPG